MLIDSNILIYALNSSSPKHARAKEFILEHQSKFILAQQNIFETLRILTHAKFPNPFKYDEAIKAVSAIVSHANIIQPTFETPEIAFALIKKYGLSGSEIFDGYLVATALSHEVTEIATDNLRDFKKYEEITVTAPF